MDIRPVVLAGRRVRLKPLALEHHSALSAVLDPALLRWFPKPAATPEELRTFIADALAYQAAGTALPFATVALPDGKPVGSTRFLNIDRAHRHVEIGATWIGRAWQRSALNTEAKVLMMTHAFEVWDALRVEFKTDALNAQSRAALERLGAVAEGRFRNHMVTASGRVRDSVWYSVVAEEWPDLKQRLAARLAQE
jgi:RimJ/RimL family protein N-acetyltransferase